jgi:hypothetical protein
MTKDEALKMAIEALQTIHDENFSYLTINKLGGENNQCMVFAREAIKSCKQALEQPAQEPVAWEDKEDKWSADIEKAHPVNSHEYELWDVAQKMINNRHSKSSLISLVCWLLVRLHKQPAQEQPAQEPVAWMNDIAFSINKDELTADKFGDIVPLYTHPHQWQGLTDDEIDKIIEKHKLMWMTTDFARAIEQALKDKNSV